jgi:hypothetical protein
LQESPQNMLKKYGKRLDMSATAVGRRNFGPGYVDNGTWMRQSIASLGEMVGSGWRRVVADTSAPVATLGSRTHVVAPVAEAYSLLDMVADLSENGFPVSLIAELANVERKTVYNWMNKAVTPQQETETRLAGMYPLLRKAFDGNYAIMRRVWRTKSRTGESLQGICGRKEVDVAVLEKHLRSIEASIKRNTLQDPRRPPEENHMITAFGEHPVADFTQF